MAENGTVEKKIEGAPAVQEGQNNNQEGAGSQGPRSYTEAEFNELKSKYEEADRIVKNANQFIETDPEIKERLGIYAESATKGVPYAELIKQREEAKNKTSTPKEPKQEALTAEQIEKLVESRLQNRLEPFTAGQAELAQEKSKQAIMKENEWATEETWKEFEIRFEKQIRSEAEEVYRANYPKLSQQQAYDQAISRAANIPDKVLFTNLMLDKRDEWIIGGKRKAPQLPDGMRTALPTGKDADVLAKARKAYASIEGDGDKVAQLVAEYAPQLGLDPDKAHKLISGSK